MTGLPAAVAPSRIGQIAVVVRDLERAVAFYRAVLATGYLRVGEELLTASA